MQSLFTIFAGHIIVHAAQILTENNKQTTGTQTVVWKSHLIEDFQQDESLGNPAYDRSQVLLAGHSRFGTVKIPQCHSRCGMIKIPPCSEVTGAKHWPKICSPSLVMVIRVGYQYLVSMPYQGLVLKLQNYW
jgi:hypothetical protein